METGAPLSLFTGVSLPQSSQRRQKRYTQTPIANAPSAGGDPRRGDPPADLVEFSQFNQPPPLRWSPPQSTAFSSRSPALRPVVPVRVRRSPVTLSTVPALLLDPFVILTCLRVVPLMLLAPGKEWPSPASLVWVRWWSLIWKQWWLVPVISTVPTAVPLPVIVSAGQSDSHSFVIGSGAVMPPRRPPGRVVIGDP